jgi:hypothetical protein
VCRVPGSTNNTSPSTVQASFGFNFGALGARPAKQASLPPQLSSRRTPVRTTPRGANGSAQRHRSASIQRSSASKRQGTPKDHTVITPHLGKRKRGSTLAEPNADDGEHDELSPDREEIVRSIEKSRRVVGTVSPIHEEVDNVADELSILEDGASTVRKTIVPVPAALNGTPVSIPGGSIATQTPIANSSRSMRSSSRRSISRRTGSRSTEPELATPSMIPNGRPRPSSASRANATRVTPSAAQADDESEDELSPPQANGTTPRVVASAEQEETTPYEEDRMEVDELSSPAQPSPVQATPAAQKAEGVKGTRGAQAAEEAAAKQPAKRGRPRRVVPDNENDASSAPPAMKTAKRDRPTKSVETKPTTTPASRRLGDKSAAATDGLEEDDQLDELSPDKDRSADMSKQPSKRREEVVTLSDGEESEEYEEPDPEEEPALTPRPAAKPQSPKRAQQMQSSKEKSQRKRHKFLGPKHAISVMRIKGSTVRGITVADTTRTILEETINHRISRMAEKMQASNDSANRKELRSELNMSLSFKESLDEKLLDLQDANDVLSTNFKKMKLFKRDNAELRKDILRLQNNRQEVALEHDDAQAEFDAEKMRVDARNKLSEDMFSIEAAIQQGRKKARKEGREDEGPEVPLSMLLGVVGEEVGSSGGGLLSNLKVFNSALEKAAGWLEGRA